MGTVHRELTGRQEDVLQGLIKLVASRVWPPTVAELAAYLDDADTSVVRFHLMALRRKGYITWEPKKARTMRVLRQPSG